LIETGHYRDAIVLLEAERDAAVHASRCDRAFAVTLNNLGSAYYQAGRYLDAQRAYEASLLVRRSLPEPNETDARDAARTLSNLGTAYLELHQISKAEAVLVKAARALDLLDPAGLPIVRVWLNLATAYKLERRWDEAEDLFRKSLAVRERLLGPTDRDIAMALNNLGVLLLERNRSAEAQPLLERAVAIWEGSLGPSHPQVAAGLHNLATVFMALDRVGSAQACFEQAIHVAETTLPADHPNLAAYRLGYATFLAKTGRKKEAHKLEELARESLKRSTTENLSGFTVDARLAH
jgi:tetratricopeptide (TPR) repeat protein